VVSILLPATRKWVVLSPTSHTECLREPTAQYIIVHKSDDGSSDAVRGYASCHAVTLLHPKFLTFLFAPDGARRSVVVLSEIAIRTRGYSSILAEVVTMYQVTLAGPSSRLQLAAAAIPGPLVYRSMESQRKEETLIEKLNALFVLFRGDARRSCSRLCWTLS
jgi:hypothetical protein